MSDEFPAYTNEEIVTLAERYAKYFSRVFAWKEGWRDLYSVVWEILNGLQRQQKPVQYWWRLVRFRMIDWYRKETRHRRVFRMQAHQFGTAESGIESRAADCVADMDFAVPARRETPDTFARAIAPFEDVYKKLPSKHRTVLLHLYHGLLLREIGGAMGCTESNISRILRQILEVTGGEYCGASTTKRLRKGKSEMQG